VKKQSSRRQKSLTSARTGKRPARQAAVPSRPKGGLPVLRWLTTSRLVLVLGIVVAATILTVMYVRLARPDATPTPLPTAGTPAASLPLTGRDLAAGEQPPSLLPNS